MKVLYKINYIQRDLYVILYEDKYLMVYRSSGLNPGRAGRILPFANLAAPPRATISGEVPGYIYKEFYFGSAWVHHRKGPSEFGPGIAEFLLELEEFLEDHPTTEIDYDFIKSYKDMLPVAIRINTELDNATEGLEPFDWKDLIKE